MQTTFATLMTALLGSRVHIEQNYDRPTPERLSDTGVLSRIEPGQTTRAWLIDRIGPPDAAWQAESGSDILRYDDHTCTRTKIPALILFGFDIDRQQVGHLYFEVRDAHVVRYWRDCA